ncbi:UNVERIFIED_CONTAM: hypothetical protein GTU68_039030 [Idotea baltica]|nr:hypothetical protein [Idotea baltica]
MKWSSLRSQSKSPGHYLITGLPFIWLLLFFLLPFLLVLKISFATAMIAIPPYTDILHWSDGQLSIVLDIDNYFLLLSDNIYLSSYLGSLKIAFISTLICLSLGYPMAYAISRTKKSTQNILLLLVMMPAWTALLIRIYAWMGILSNNGLLNQVITGLSLLLLFVAMSQVLGWPHTRGSFTIWIAHTTFCSAYVAVIVASRIRELDLSIEEAAMDLGAKPFKVFCLITIPMISSSLAAGAMISFALSLDDLVLASFVSGPGATTLPMEIFSAVRLGVKPEINAVASLLLLAVSSITFILWFFSRKKEKSL